MLKLPFHIGQDADSLRKWLLQELIARYTKLYLTHVHMQQHEWYFLYVARVFVNHFPLLEL